MEKCTRRAPDRMRVRGMGGCMRRRIHLGDEFRALSKVLADASLGQPFGRAKVVRDSFWSLLEQSAIQQVLHACHMRRAVQVFYQGSNPRSSSCCTPAGPQGGAAGGAGIGCGHGVRAGRRGRH
eukprot:599879-Prymnesium_polylepis.1